MSVPDDLRYTDNHEWLRTDGESATVGVTEFAATALGDIVFVGPPRVGERLVAGQACGEVESTKSVSDLYAPVGGEVVAVNEALADEPGVVNTDPYGAGWLFRMRLDGPPDNLLEPAAYEALVASRS